MKDAKQIIEIWKGLSEEQKTILYHRVMWLADPGIRVNKLRVFIYKKPDRRKLNVIGVAKRRMTDRR